MQQRIYKFSFEQLQNEHMRVTWIFYSRLIKKCANSLHILINMREYHEVDSSIVLVTYAIIKKPPFIYPAQLNSIIFYWKALEKRKCRSRKPLCDINQLTQSAYFNVATPSALRTAIEVSISWVNVAQSMTNQLKYADAVCQLISINPDPQKSRQISPICAYPA